MIVFFIYMNTKRLGNIGEAYALSKLVELGIPVYQQFGDNEPADFLIIVNNKILKIQVKATTMTNDERAIFDLTSSTVNRKNGVRHKYSCEEVDYFLCYDIINKQLLVYKNNGNVTGVTFRYKKVKNNQEKNVKYAQDYLLTEHSFND